MRPLWFHILAVFNILVGVAGEPRGAYREKDEVNGASVCDALRTAGRDEYHIAWPDLLCRQLANFNATEALENDITLYDFVKPMKPCCYARLDAGSRN